MKATDVLKLGRIAVSRAAREAVYLRSGVDITRPSSIRAIVTERCNYKCLYCNHWRQQSYPDEMSLEEWQGILTSLRSFLGYYVVQFMGGEPFVWKGFVELIESCAANEIGWGVITNGSALTKSVAERMAQAQPVNIDVSLDSTDPAVHDRARGVAGSRDKVMEGIRHLSDARAAVGAQFPIRIKTTVDRHNFGGLEDLIKWAANVPGTIVDPSPVRLAAPDAQAHHYLGPAEWAQFEAAMMRLIEMKRAGWPIETTEAKLRAFASHFRGERTEHGYEECRVGLRNLNINPMGDVTHCWNFERIGNLRSQSAKAIWHSPDRQAQVERTINCSQAKGNLCGMACSSHRSLAQEVSRGLMLLRAG
ncbi:radical SAM protein [Sphingomonas sp. MG17]|uniref:Radical SAM protein n=1 Tax=Sphingomonas tagetis TaxID=2949092 RepID=A0A9X2HL39_9SPHN|nr:radical SAM protein [Sphingomonas tagetis]MCP3733216.1 radical SAM protein [Sphingomonas tagetis]